MGINVVVCIKQTPASVNILIDSQTGKLKWDGVAMAINPFDEYALEEGIRLKERVPGSWCGALTLGPLKAEEVLREAVARGCDEAFHLWGEEFEGSDTYATSYVLCQGLKKIAQIKGSVDVVLCGKQTNDGDTGQVGPSLGAWLDWPSAAYIKKVEGLDEKRIRVHRMMEDGSDVLELPLPAVLSVVKEINEPRLPSLKGKMASRKVAIPRWGPQDLGCDRSQIGVGGSPTTVARWFNPPSRPQGTPIQGSTPEEKSIKLFEKLNELKLI